MTIRKYLSTWLSRQTDSPQLEGLHLPDLTDGAVRHRAVEGEELVVSRGDLHTVVVGVVVGLLLIPVVPVDGRAGDGTDPVALLLLVRVSSVVQGLS